MSVHNFRRALRCAGTAHTFDYQTITLTTNGSTVLLVDIVFFSRRGLCSIPSSLISRITRMDVKGCIPGLSSLRPVACASGGPVIQLLLRKVGQVKLRRIEGKAGGRQYRIGRVRERVREWEPFARLYALRDLMHDRRELCRIVRPEAHTPSRREGVPEDQADLRPAYRPSEG